LAAPLRVAERVASMVEMIVVEMMVEWR
jgi:hypothetical protein